MKAFIIVILLVLQCYVGNAQSTKDVIKTITANGIELPNLWPPRDGNNEIREEMNIPYLRKPPATIPINIGRQLFVDDFLIEKTNLTRVYHQPTYYPGNPVIKPDRSWEFNETGGYAAPFSGGIWYDEKDSTYKMWYLAGRGKEDYQTCYAISKDGKHWIKPDLHVYGNTNIIDTSNRDSGTMWLDKEAKDPDKRYKFFEMERRSRDNRWQIVLKYSSDGIHFGKGVAQSGDMYDRTTAFYNPFLKKWVLSLKTQTKIGRSRNYIENANPETLVSLSHRIREDVRDENIVPWFGADNKDPHNPKFPEVEPQIYDFDAMPYESLMLGYFVVWQGPDNAVCRKLGIQKRNEVFIGYSRDGFHWYRPTHTPFLGVDQKEGAWNWGNVQSVVGSPIIKGDSLYFYVSGRRLNNSHEMWDGNMSTGLATLRRDGFASMGTNLKGTLTTGCVVFNGKYLFINADVKGILRVEILDSSNNVIPGYTSTNCIPFHGNKIKEMISWKNKKELSSLRDKPVKFKFYISNGSIYSFWVSPWKTGESRGYTAGGGAGLSPSGMDLPLK